MRLTVGPLPPSVYWRRRAVVLVGFALVVLVMSYACGGPGTSTAGPGSPSNSSSTSAGSTTSAPGLSASPTPEPTAKPTAFTLPSAGAGVPCSDAEMEVTASASPATVPRGEEVEVTITIKNISGRACGRDIGADVQELMVMDGTTKIWSSDDCNPNRGSDVTSFAADRQVTFTLTWNGRRSRSGTGTVNCNAQPPDVNKYQLVARLDRKLSAPFDIHVAA
jgi:hypothetical protein